MEIKVSIQLVSRVSVSHPDLCSVAERSASTVFTSNSECSKSPTARKPLLYSQSSSSAFDLTRSRLQHRY